ncbi:hypothetical protein MUP95_04055, partial [bacterium]|nr:hypothetical protein [bacterium]
MSRIIKESDLLFYHLRDHLIEDQIVWSRMSSLLEDIRNNKGKIAVINCLDATWKLATEFFNKLFTEYFKWADGQESTQPISAIILLNAESSLTLKIDGEKPFVIPVLGKDLKILQWIGAENILGDEEEIVQSELTRIYTNEKENIQNIPEKAKKKSEQICKFNHLLFQSTKEKEWESTLDLKRSISLKMEKPNIFDFELRNYLNLKELELIKKGYFLLLSGTIQSGYIDVHKLIYEYPWLRERIAEQICLCLQGSKVDTLVAFADPANQLSYKIQHLMRKKWDIEINIIPVSDYNHPLRDLLHANYPIKNRKVALITTVISTGNLLDNLSSDIGKLNGSIEKEITIFATSEEAIARRLKKDHNNSSSDVHILCLNKRDTYQMFTPEYKNVIDSKSLFYINEKNLVPQKPRIVSCWEWMKNDDLNNRLWEMFSELEEEKQRVIIEHKDSNREHYFLFFDNKIIINRYGDEIAGDLAEKINKVISTPELQIIALLIASTQYGADKLGGKIQERLNLKLPNPMDMIEVERRGSEISLSFDRK